MKLRDKTIRTVRGINSKLYKLDFKSSYFKYIILASRSLYGNIIQNKEKLIIIHLNKKYLFLIF